MSLLDTFNANQSVVALAPPAVVNVNAVFVAGLPVTAIYFFYRSF